VAVEVEHGVVNPGEQAAAGGDAIAHEQAGDHHVGAWAVVDVVGGPGGEVAGDVTADQDGNVGNDDAKRAARREDAAALEQKPLDLVDVHVLEEVRGVDGTERRLRPGQGPAKVVAEDTLVEARGAAGEADRAGERPDERKLSKPRVERTVNVQPVGGRDESAAEVELLERGGGAERSGSFAAAVRVLWAGERGGAGWG